MAQLIPVKDGKEQESLPIPDTGLVLGRDADCEFPIQGEGISRRHARVVYVGDMLCVEDLESTNGVIVNGQQIRRRQILHPGDIMQICNHDFHIGGVLPVPREGHWGQIVLLAAIFVVFLGAIVAWPIILKKTSSKEKLHASPIRVLSDPEKAEVYDHGKLVGYTPLSFDKTLHGSYRLLLRKAGFNDKEIVVNVPQGMSTRIHVLEGRVKGAGSLNVVTLPATANVYVDGKLVGSTEANAEVEMESKPLRVPNIDLSEEHIVYMELDGRRSRTYRTRKWSENLSLAIWSPDRLVLTTDGDSKLGMVRRRAKNGDLLLAIAPDRDVWVKSSDIDEERLVPPPVLRYGRGVRMLGDRQRGLELIVDPFPDTEERM